MNHHTIAITAGIGSNIKTFSEVEVDIEFYFDREGELFLEKATSKNGVDMMPFIDELDIYDSLIDVLLPIAEKQAAEDYFDRGEFLYDSWRDSQLDSQL